MIAHRLGTLANCDARLEIDDGRVVTLEHGRRRPKRRTR
jgi:ABC-type multidrug transport system fused ATPase/permease subunit